MEHIDVVVDLQYGSTGKGLIVGFLAEYGQYDTVVTAWAPNAGHTYIDKDGRKYVHTHLANGIVAPFLRRVMLGPGSLINPQTLLQEIEQCRDIIDGKGVKIVIHPHAAVVTDRHIAEEAGPMTKIGSTKKGVGAAMCQRIRRDPDDMNVAAHCPELAQYVTTTQGYREEMTRATRVLVEGAQGYGLSMYHGFYPYTTSRDVSTLQILADTGIPMSAMYDRHGLSTLRIIGTCRTFPIRVANRYDEQGTQVGYSGPCYNDQAEITFESIGQPTELTTVTKLPRRIFTFSGQQIREAIAQNRAHSVFLNFINYVRTSAELIDIVEKIETDDCAIRWVGTGPRGFDVRYVAGNRGERIANIIDIWKGLKV